LFKKYIIIIIADWFRQGEVAMGRRGTRQPGAREGGIRDRRIQQEQEQQQQQETTLSEKLKINK
jgi:hypothetical protein